MTNKKLESKFKKELKDELEVMFPGSYIFPIDPTYKQGMPDLCILYKDKWAVLEGKRDIKAPYQPNQEFYIEQLNDMSFCSMICPENKEDVLNELQQKFRN